MLQVNVYSHRDFDNICRLRGWNDDNIESLSDIAFVSIIRSETSREVLDKTIHPSDECHWFKNNHLNVLNLEFDDEEEDRDWFNKTTGMSGCDKAISPEQAQILYNFIKTNIGKNFFIHCRAGVSRSQAVGRFIKEFFPEYNYEERKENPCLYPNERVLTELKRCWYKEFGLFGATITTD